MLLNVISNEISSMEYVRKISTKKQFIKPDISCSLVNMEAAESLQRLDISFDFCYMLLDEYTNSEISPRISSENWGALQDMLENIHGCGYKREGHQKVLNTMTF